MLRIISILLITSHHFYGHGFLDLVRANTFSLDKGFTSGNIFIMYLATFGNIGVNIFVLITGYFSCKSGYNARKIVQILLQEEFYSLTIVIVLGISKLDKFTVSNVVRHGLVIIYNPDYWFGVTFVGLMFIGNFINAVLKALDKKAYRWLLFTNGLYFCVLQTFTNNSNSFWALDAVPWFVYLYCIGGYLQLHSDPIFQKPYRWLQLLVFILMVSFCAFMPIIYQYWTPKNEFSSFYELDLVNRDRLSCLVSSVALFALFAGFKIGKITVINIASSGTFGVYLLQENAQMRDIWWQRLFDATRYYHKAWRLAVQCLFAMTVIWLCGVVVDVARQYLVEKPLFWCYDTLVAKCSKKKEQDAEGGEEGRTVEEGKGKGKAGKAGGETERDGRFSG